MTALQPVATPSPWAGHARACLKAAMRRDHAAAQQAANELLRAFGPDVLPQVMLAWIDTAIASQGITLDDEGKPARLMFGDVDTGRTSTDADDVDPIVAWVGRLINARIANDEATYRALMNVALDSGRWNRYVTVLLDGCAQTCRLGTEIQRIRDGGDQS